MAQATSLITTSHSNVISFRLIPICFYHLLKMSGHGWGQSTKYCSNCPSIRLEQDATAGPMMSGNNWDNPSHSTDEAPWNSYGEDRPRNPSFGCFNRGGRPPTGEPTGRQWVGGAIPVTRCLFSEFLSKDLCWRIVPSTRPSSLSPDRNSRDES